MSDFTDWYGKLDDWNYTKLELAHFAWENGFKKAVEKCETKKENQTKCPTCGSSNIECNTASFYGPIKGTCRVCGNMFYL